MKCCFVFVFFLNRSFCFDCGWEWTTALGVCPQGQRRIKETLLTSFRAWPHPLSFLYCVFFFAPCALDLNLPVIALSLPQTSRQGPAAVQEKVEDEKSWNFSNMLLQIFIIYWYIWKYICIHFKFHTRDYWTLDDCRSGLILLWQDICSHKWIHNSLVSNS